MTYCEDENCPGTDHVKSYNIWHCEDCHSVGFYYFKSDDEIREEHRKECTYIPPTRWPEGAEL